MRRTARSSLQLPQSRLASVSLALLAACGEGDRDRDPGAGQTGSPAVPVPPDRESPVPFRPPQPEPPMEELPEVPRVPFPGPPERAAVFGDWLYVATPEALFAFDTSAPLATSVPRPLLPGARPQWIGIDGETLSLIATVVADDPARVEDGPVTRLFQLDLSSDPGAPRVVSSGIDLPGRLERARLEPGRLITLSGIAADRSHCTGEPTFQYPIDRHPNQMLVTELGLDAGRWVVTEQVTVEGAQGFIETREAFVLTSDRLLEPDSPMRRHAELTVVEVSDGTLTRWPRLDVAGWPQRGGSVGVEAGKLAIFMFDDDWRYELFVFSPGAPSPEIGSLSGAAFGAVDAWDGGVGMHFDGPFVLIPSRELGPTSEAGVITSGRLEPGVVIDWQREGGPAVAGALPEDLLKLFPVGERWLGIGRERSVLFHLGAEGTLETDAEFGPPEGLSDRAREWFWDAASQRGWLSFLVAGTGEEGVPEQSAASILDLSTATPAWRAGPSLRGALSAGLVSTPAGLFGMTRSNGSPLLEALEPSAAQSQVVILGEQPLALAWGQSVRAELRMNPDGGRRVDIEQDGDVASVDLSYSADQLRAIEDGVLAYSIAGYDASLAEDRATLSVFAGTPATLESEVALPVAATVANDDIQHRWLEILTQGQQVAFLEQRTADCRSQRDCEALGLGLDADGVSGFQQYWLSPFDRVTAQFGAPLLLPAPGGATQLGASRLSTADATTLVLSTPLEVSDENEVLRARVELLRIPELTPSGIDRAQRITLPGEPMFVEGDVAVSIEPAGPAVEASASALIHRLRLGPSAAYIEQTLELPAGHAGHAWARERGYVLVIPDDRCADPNSTLITVGLAEGELSVVGELRLPGTEWRLARASDELALLTRTNGAFDQYAVIDVSAAGVSLRGYEVVPFETPVDVLRDQVGFSRTAPGGH